MCQIQIEKKENYIAVALDGELTLGCTGTVKEKLKDYAQMNNQYHIVVDMSGVSFVDSSGLGIMVAWFKLCNEQNGKLVFYGLDTHVNRIIGYAKLDKIFNIVDTLEAAEAML